MILALCFLFFAISIPYTAQSQSIGMMVVSDRGEYSRVGITFDKQNILLSPAEGLWSIAEGWEDDWPTGWRHANPTEMERAGEWTILRGKMETPRGSWSLSDSYLPGGRIVKCVRRFVWEGREPLEPCTLSVRFQTPGTGQGAFMPGILYYGNPSGAKSGRVPVYDGQPGGGGHLRGAPLPHAVREFGMEK